MRKTKKFLCMMCNNIIEVPFGIPKPSFCPKCGAPMNMIHRLDKGHGHRHRWGRKASRS